MRPINDRVVVKPAPAEEKTKGGIIIPDTAKEKPQRGEVVAVGHGVYSVTGEAFLKTTIEVGTMVVFPAFGGTKMTIEGEEFVVMKENDLLAILEK